MLEVILTRQVIKDLLLSDRRGLPRQEFNEVVDLLANGKTLAPKYRDHALKGKYAGFRECHIRPDWLLVYRIERQTLTLLLMRTGTHSDLF